MSELQFGNNYQDRCVQHGTNAGFQFDFFCEVCRDAWRSPFVPFSTGRMTSWLGKASGLIGGLGNVQGAMEGLAEAGYGAARDKAFKEAIENAKAHFHRCAKCHNYVCARCFSKASGLCTQCAPNAQVELEAAKAAGMAEGAREKAQLAGQELGKKMDVTGGRQLVCPKCSAETKGAKFCPECGHNLAAKPKCSKCSAELEPGTKFCPECGQKQA